MASTVASVPLLLRSRLMSATLAVVVTITLSLIECTSLAVGRLAILVHKGEVLELACGRYATLVHHHAIRNLDLEQRIETIDAHWVHCELLHEQGLLLGVHGVA